MAEVKRGQYLNNTSNGELIHTYNPKDIVVTISGKTLTGFAEDSFVVVQPNADAVTKKVGCDGEIVRSISPDETYNVQVSLLWGSVGTEDLYAYLVRDRQSGDGLFSISIQDLTGEYLFVAPNAWIGVMPEKQFAREAPTLQWTIQTGRADTLNMGAKTH